MFFFLYIKLVNNTRMNALNEPVNGSACHYP